MGAVLDAAAVALALVVTGSLALLSWTLGVSAVRAVGRGRRRVAAARAELERAAGDLHDQASLARAHLGDLAARLIFDRRKGQ